MHISVALFAVLRERAGAGAIELELPDGANAGDAVRALADVIGDCPVVLAVNRVYAGSEQVLSEGDEVALIPPVSGGAEDNTISVDVRAEPLSTDAALAAVRDDRAGAIVLFCGVTREVRQLEYEAYEEMARERMGAIARVAAATDGVCRVAVAHRVGVVPLGEPSVLVAVSAAHRGPAFAAARACIDSLKAQVPIWKREVDGARSEWVEGALPEPD
jgi:molybdopterin synthase catalytic subunit